MDFDEACEAIRSMEVRGAAKIGRTAASALADAARDYSGEPAGFEAYLRDRAEELLATRPTAVSLKNALNRVLRAVEAADGDVPALVEAAEDAAEAFAQDSHDALDAIADHAAELFPDGGTVLTHCNSQAALGGVVRAHEQGKAIRVVATESRPFRQGRITVSQLAKAGVPATFVVDSAVAAMLPDVDIVVTGADTITARGEVVNKVGTRMVAVLASERDVPFYTCAETYKFSPDTLHGGRVEIERRPVEEVADPAELPDGVAVENPVFDVTPPRHVDALVTEIGVIRPEIAAQVILDRLADGPL